MSDDFLGCLECGSVAGVNNKFDSTDNTPASLVFCGECGSTQITEDPVFLIATLRKRANNYAWLCERVADNTTNGLTLAKSDGYSLQSVCGDSLDMYVEEARESEETNLEGGNHG